MRRSQPDKRRHRVLLAVDDSKSMSETSTSAFALESLALISNAMARLEIGDMGVVRFGQQTPELLHAFDSPLGSGAGAEIVGRMRFDADNTIDDRPMMELLEFLDGVLDTDASDAGDGGAKQLVIILADGRFHEKEGLRKAVMDATGRGGVMYAFVVLDGGKGGSILDMQTVEFVGEEGGGGQRPVFRKYIDEFPFPLYCVVGEVGDLPMAVGGVVRGWMEMMTGGSGSG